MSEVIVKPPGFTDEDVARFLEEKKTKPNLEAAILLFSAWLIGEVEVLLERGNVGDAHLFKESEDESAWQKYVRLGLIDTMPDDIKKQVDAARTKH